MKKRVLSLLLTLVMLLGMIPASAWAAEQVTVYVTVSDRGVIPTSTGGQIMARVPVSVEAGATVDAVLQQLHQTYCADGYATSVSAYGTTVNKLWGQETGNTLFFLDNVGLTTGVGVDTVTAGAHLVASVNQDGATYADWYAAFDQTTATVQVGQELTLTMKGHLGMAYLPEDMNDVPLSGIQLGTMANNAFTALEGKTTNPDGQVTLSFDAAGTYIVSASGTVATQVSDWYQPPYDGSVKVDVDAPIIAPVCVVTVEAPAQPESPRFERLEFATTAVSDWVSGETYDPLVQNYTLTIKRYSTSALSLQRTTTYDTEKYTAVAEYTDVDGVRQSIPVNSGSMTSLPNQPFDSSVLTITLTDKANEENRTVYTFQVFRPRDTTKQIKSNGITLIPEGRALLTATYQGNAEGVMLRADETGAPASGKGVAGTTYYYRTYVQEALPSFSLTLTGNTVYSHLRYSTDEGVTWAQLPVGGGNTDVISFSAAAEGNPVVKVLVEILDDQTYSDNVKAGAHGFEGAEPTVYTLWVEQLPAAGAVAELVTAQTDSGDWYPAFRSDLFSYNVVVPNGAAAPTLSYTVSDGATVKVGSADQTADESGTYTLTLTTSQKSIVVTSADGNFSNTYKIGYMAKSRYAVPDSVTDYLCINSQYTNASYGLMPENTLRGSLKSLGNFGGYITYFYESGLTNDADNLYGVDFYVYGNANVDSSTSTGTSFFEPGQVWVSEDGANWYALAGSAHYDEGVEWDYTVTYTRASNGKTAWSDNLGNSNDGSSRSGAWPLAANYPLNSLVGGDSIVLSGVMLPAADGSVTGDGSCPAYTVNWGYADAFSNGTIGADVNPYLDNSSHTHRANGFDLAWAVDSQGQPVDVSDKEFHYVKVQTASNIWHTSFGEKSTEVTQVVRVSGQQEAVGVTAAPTGVTVTDGAESKSILFSADKQIYSAHLGDMKYISIRVNGAADDDNIYINNQRVSAQEAATGFKVTRESGEKLIRIVVQNGDKEPLIYLLKLTSDATDSSDLIEGIKVNSTRAETTDGSTYTVTVGHRIGDVSIAAITGGSYSINGTEAVDRYSLSYGENTFTITAMDGSVSQTVTLRVFRENAPVASGTTITVYFTLLGDESHGEDGESHTLRQGGLQTWISRRSFTVPAEAMVLDVLTLALGEDYTFVNADGNYISAINGLAEFTNGPLSGWMYTLNGRHGDKGVAEQTVANGDSIVFHYTDDYTAEEGSEQWVGPYVSGGTTDVTDEETPTAGATPFTDATGHWAEDAIQYVYEQGLMNGVSESSFAPGATLNRAMLVAMLHRLAGTPDGGENTFTDVEAGKWYTDAVVWAGGQGIVSGMGDGTFAPTTAITREQLALMLYNYAKYKGYDVSLSADLTDFADGDQMSDWAAEAMAWANAVGLITGRTEDTLAPGGTATRAEAATILKRFLETIVSQYQ